MTDGTYFICLVSYILLLSSKLKSKGVNKKLGIQNYAGLRATTDIVILTTENQELKNERSVPTKGIQVLLVKRDEEPFSDTWTLPGGFIGHDIAISDCVNNKLLQKTGVSGIYTEQLYTYGDNLERDPRDRVITVAYIALVSKSMLNIQECHGDKETKWFWVNAERNSDGKVVSMEITDEVTGEKVDKLGFDHYEIIADAITRLANKLMYTDIGFHLVDKNFTIKELQMAYEAILGKPIAGFRRIIGDKVEETGQNTSQTREKPELHRPAKLYTKKIK